MAQPQAHQPNRPKVPTQSYAYTINRMHNEAEWMLSSANPRTWSKKTEKALLFSSPQEVEHYISLLFKPDERDGIFTGRIRMSN